MLINERNEIVGPYTVQFVPKSWGCERWYVNTDQYCGKSLFIFAGRKLSYHYHKMKDEVFLVHHGSVILRYGFSDDPSQALETILEEGDTFHIPPGIRHQLEAITDTEIIEFSSHHEDSDSYRLVKGD